MTIKQEKKMWALKIKEANWDRLLGKSAWLGDNLDTILDVVTFDTRKYAMVMERYCCHHGTKPKAVPVRVRVTVETLK